MTKIQKKCLVVLALVAAGCGSQPPPCTDSVVGGVKVTTCADGSSPPSVTLPDGVSICDVRYVSPDSYVVTKNKTDVTGNLNIATAVTVLTELEAKSACRRVSNSRCQSIWVSSLTYRIDRDGVRFAKDLGTDAATEFLSYLRSVKLCQ